MKINQDPTNTKYGHHYMSEKGIVLSTSRSQGIGDSLGRTSEAAMIYDQDRPKLIEGILQFFISTDTSNERKGRIYVIRFPGDIIHYVRGNSRDHVIKTATAMKVLNQDIWLDHFLKNRTQDPSADMRYTPGQRIWLHAIRSKAWSWIYLAYMLLGTAIIPAYNWILRAVSGNLKTWENPYDWYRDNFPRYAPTKWQQKCEEKTIPTFASYYTAFGLLAVEAKIPRKILQRTMRIQFEKTNYVARAICGEKINPDPFYIPSRKNRWSIRLDRMCDRDIRPYAMDRSEQNMELARLYYWQEKSEQ